MTRTRCASGCAPPFAEVPLVRHGRPGFRATSGSSAKMWCSRVGSSIAGKGPTRDTLFSEKNGQPKLSRCMQRISFDADWLDPSRVKGPELAATWASLQIRVGESCVTEVLDKRAKTVRHNVDVPLYPLAEWLAANWWFLGHEMKNESKASDPNFRSRHALITNREGYAYPDLEIASSGSITHLVWRAHDNAWSNVKYLAHGEARIDREGFREDCARFIDQVTRRLGSLGIEGTYLQEEWAAVQSASREEARFCRTAAWLGWDPYALEDSKRNWLLALSCQSDELLAEATAVLDPDSPEHGWTALTNAIRTTKSVDGCAFDRIRSLHGSVCLPEDIKVTTPWQVGYNWARRLRDGLGCEEDPLPGMAELADVLGEERTTLDGVAAPHSVVNDIPMLDGVVTQTDDELPALALRATSEPGRRFHLCRAIAEILVARGADMLITRAPSARQQRNRAFAAEFLVPASALRSRVNRPVVDGDDIDELATQFGVSSYIVEYQIRNHRITQIAPF